MVNSTHGNEVTASPNLVAEGTAPVATSSSGVPFVEGRRVVSAWVVSIAIHAGLFIGMLLLVFPYSPHLQSLLPVTRAELVGDPQAGLLAEAAFARSSIPAFQNQPSDVLDPRHLRQQTPKTDLAGEIAGKGTSRKSELSIVGIGGGGGDFSKYGLDVGGEMGAEFFGLGRTARGVQKIVYVVDRSGSMADTFEVVRQELRRSIGELRRSQKFHVIFFNAGEPLENPPRRLVSGIAAHKHELFEFLGKVTTGGSTDPSAAMRRALSLEPDVIYFLTDGEFEKALIPRLDEWNKARRTRIFTIAFFGSGGAALLEQIAREHGGEYRFVTENDLP